jgi:hypothetical protein
MMNIRMIVVEGGDSSGISGTGETPQIAKRPRRLTARPAESVRLKRKSSILMNQSFCPKHLKHWIYGTKKIYFIF